VKLSVVVPIYNVEAYLTDALSSVAGQTLRDLEVIMVDDGSTDGSALIAKSFAAADSRFRLLQQENQRQGPARNLGIRHATGDYLAFLDGDDLVPRNAYNLLVGSLEATGSDIAAGDVRRFGSGWISPTVVHADVYGTTIPRTSAARYPVLLRDCTLWNKVYRRSFWDSFRPEFWAARYEDIPVCIQAYVLARSIDIRREIVYYWRARESGQLSRHQKARELENVAGRIAACTEAKRIIERHAPALGPAFDRRVLDNDLAILLSTFEFASESDRQQLLELGAGYLRSVADPVFRDTSAMGRLQYHLIREGMHDELLEVMRYARRGDAANAPLVRLGRPRPKWYISHPYFADPARKVPLHVYDASREMSLNVRLDAVRWHGEKLRIEGCAYIRKLDAPREQGTRIDVLLRNPLLRRTVRLKARRVKRPDVTARSGQAAACYDWSGFVVEIDPARLSNLGTWRAASWELRVRVRGQGVRREGPVSRVTPGSALWPEARWVASGVRLQPAPEPDGRFTIRAGRPAALATACRADGDQLQLEGWSTVPVGSKAAIVVSLQQGGGKPTRIPATAAGRSAGRYGFRAALPISMLLSAAGSGSQPGNGQGPPAGKAETAMPAADEIHWDFAFDPGTGGKVRLAGEPAVIGHRLAEGGQELTTYLTAFGNLSAVQRKCCLIVREASWTAGDRLSLRGDYPGAGAMPPVIQLRSTGSGYQHAVPLRWQGDTFTASVPAGAMPGLAGDLPLGIGRWELLAQTEAGETRVVADRQLLTGLPEPRQVGIHHVAADSYRGDCFQIQVRAAAADAGKYTQRKLQEWYRSGAAGGRIDEVAVFDSHGGKQYSCNPRAIYEELRRRDAGLECAWITRDGQFAAPDGSRVVVRGSREHYELAARARYLVSNMFQPEWYHRPDGQVYLQTWHGTPLKRICLDVERPQFANGMAYNDRVRHDVASWSALLSPNQFSTPIFRRAFGFDGEILESGYPRNDVLRTPDRAERAAGIRRRLGLPADQRVVLYAPTWRDDAPTRAAGYGFPQELDFGVLAGALGPDHTLLVRAHQMMMEALVTGPADTRIIDVTLYPDMADLLLISDVLITDYSSAMFDFAVTGRPMLFFTYDLERYRDRLRGFYFDFEAEAPGPLLCTTDDVIGAMQSLPDISRSYRAAYDSFTERFCGLEDGQAAARAVDWLLSNSG
jgi:CDP-glycerol glycerophosphotransferase